VLPEPARPSYCYNWTIRFRSNFFAQNLCQDFMMFKLGFSVAVLMTAAVLSVGSSLGAVREAAAASGTKVAAVAASPSAASRASAPQVYLMRGFLNVFSMGMDSLAAELRGVGISATVDSYAGWQEAARAIAANYKAGRHGPIVLVGHSFGSDAVMDMGQYLGEMGVPVALIVSFDGTYPHAASANVAHVLNIYKSAEAKITRGPGFHGEITNYNVPDAEVGHTNIDKVPRLHAMVINKIRSIRGSGSAISAPPGTSG
jgi:alpha/beta superfamily hydrolase